MAKKIPLFQVNMSADVDAALSRVLHSGYVGEGEQVKLFEKELSLIIGNEFVLTTNSGTSALMLGLRIAGIGPDDLVISTPMTCLATNMAILSVGADIVWADVDKLTGNVTPASVIDAFWYALHQLNQRPKAIMAVSWAGRLVDVDSLLELRQSKGLRLIEDNAHAFGASLNGQSSAARSDIACLSFQAIKHMTTVDGGAIVLSDKKDYERARLLRWFGLDRNSSTVMRCKQDPPEFGYKFHMNDINATIGLVNIKDVGVTLAKHRANALTIHTHINALNSTKIWQPPYEAGSSYWLYTVLVDNPEKFERFMSTKDINVSQVHDRNDTKKPFVAYNKRYLPGLEHFNSHQVSIPVGWWLSQDNISAICNAITEYSNYKGD